MWKEIKEQSIYFLKNRRFLLLLILSAIAGYGYLLTHGTCGLDDISIDLYFKNGIGVAIGRWPYYIINKFIPVAEYVPFIGDFITILLLMASVVLWCVLLRMLVPEKISIWPYVVFTVWFMDYSMNADIFVFYLQNGLGWLHLFVALSLIAFLYVYRNRVEWKWQVMIRISVIILLTLAISFYESAANVFLSGSILVMLFDLCVKKKESVFRGKNFLFALIFIARYLVYAMIGRRIIRTIIMRVFGIAAYTFYRSTSSIEWLVKGGMEHIGENISDFLAQIYLDYFAIGIVYYPIFIFVICSIIFMGFVIWFSWKQRDMLVLLAGLGVYGSMFILSVIQGDAMEYRACQAFTIFVAIVFFVITAVLTNIKKWLGYGIGILIIGAMLYSIYDMNYWFALDYEKTEYEMQVIDQIAEDLNTKGYHVAEKPLVVVGDFELPEEIYDKYCITQSDIRFSFVEEAALLANKKDLRGKYCYGQNFSSMINWSVRAFAMYAGYNVPIRQFFDYRGHKFLWADAATIDKAFSQYYPLDKELYSYSGLEMYTELYSEEEAFPNEGYIVEQDDCIIIRL